MKDIDLKTLVGKHILSGVDTSTQDVKNEYTDDFEHSAVINFILDGTTYSAIEDPSDGYRSSLRSIRKSRIKLENNFQGVEVLGIYRDQSSSGYNSADLIEFYDTANGGLVLSVGTENNDDYYPSFVGAFLPENMAVNKGRKMRSPPS